MGAAAALGIELMLKATFVLVLARGLVALMRTRAARERHLVWLTGMLTLLVLPAVDRFAPRWEIRLPAVRQKAATLFGEPLPPVSTQRQSSGSGARSDVAGRSAEPGEASLPAAVPWWLLFWAGGVLLIIGRQGLGVAGARAVIRRARPCRDTRILALTHAAVARLGLRSAPPVLLTGRFGLPAVAGLFRPAVLLPAGATGWADETLTNVLLHELAHIRRADLPVHALVGLISALYWPHPGVWLATRRLRVERERACDDAALETGVNPEGYARCLLSLAAAGRLRRGQPQAGLAMARIHELEGRLIAVLDGRARRGGHGVAHAATCAVAAGAVAILLGGAGVAAADPGRGALVEPRSVQLPAQVGQRAEFSPEASAPSPAARATLTSRARANGHASADVASSAPRAGLRHVPANGGNGISQADGLERYRSHFVTEARGLIMAALQPHFANEPDVTEAVLDEVAGRAAHDLWMMLDTRITLPADSPRTGLRAWAEGNSRISIVRGPGARTTAVVSTVMGPLPRSLPVRVSASLRVAGLQVDGKEQDILNQSLMRSGAELERRWATLITEGRQT